MKIGILTYYGDLNYGTNLQAYATLQAVKSVYPNDTVEIIPFHGFRPRILPYRNYSPISIFKDIKRICKYRAFKKNVLQIKGKDIIQRDVDKALKYIEYKQYDIIYVGADTLLELDRLPDSYDGLSAYWLKDINAKKILIAASAKNVEYEKLLPNQKREMESAVYQFAYLGVRDHNTQKVLSYFTDEEYIEYIPDPTFTMDIDYSYVESYLKRKQIKILPKSILIHTYGDDNWANELAGKLKKEGYQIITPRPVRWADYCLNDMSPFEQMGIYRYFELVITHRFHDGVFCLKNNTPFMLYNKKDSHNQSSDSKFTSLLKDFDLYPDNFIGMGAEVTADTILKTKKNSIANFRKKEDVIKNKLRDKSDDYLNFLEKTKK